MAVPAFPVFFCGLHALARSPKQVGGSKSKKIKVGKESPTSLKGRVFKIQKNLCAIFNKVAWRLRRSNKRRYANIQRRSEAKHCSSLCSQSEGNEY